MKNDGFYVRAGAGYWKVVRRGQRLGIIPRTRHRDAKQHHTRKDAEKTMHAFGSAPLVADGTIKVVEIRDGKEVAAVTAEETCPPGGSDNPMSKFYRGSDYS